MKNRTHIHKFADQASADAMIAGWLETQSVPWTLTSPPPEEWEFSTSVEPDGVEVHLAIPEWYSPSKATHIAIQIGDFAIGFQYGRESR